MPKVTVLARLSDGLPLTASMADENDAFAKEVSVNLECKDLYRFSYRPICSNKLLEAVVPGWYDRGGC